MCLHTAGEQWQIEGGESAAKQKIEATLTLEGQWPLHKKKELETPNLVHTSRGETHARKSNVLIVPLTVPLLYEDHTFLQEWVSMTATSKEKARGDKLGTHDRKEETTDMPHVMTLALTVGEVFSKANLNP